MRLPTVALAAAFALGAPSAWAQSINFSSQLPPNPQPGECYARVYIPGETREVPKRVLVQEASQRITATEPQFRWVEREIEIEGASERLELVPAEFEVERRTVVIEPQHEVIVAVPAEYETVSERVEVQAEYTVWKPGRGPIERIDQATGEIMCLVTVPAQYRTIERRIVKTPARQERRIIPAVTETFEVRVMVEPPRVKRVIVPAKTRTVRVRDMISQASLNTQTVPARFTTIMETIPGEQGRMEWRPILCETNMTPDLVRRLQRALKGRGFDPGKIDGVLGAGTLNAVEEFQQRNGLAEGSVTIETLEVLGVSPHL